MFNKMLEIQGGVNQTHVLRPTNRIGILSNILLHHPHVPFFYHRRNISKYENMFSLSVPTKKQGVTIPRSIIITRKKARLDPKSSPQTWDFLRNGAPIPRSIIITRKPLLDPKNSLESWDFLGTTRPRAPGKPKYILACVDDRGLSWYKVYLKNPQPKNPKPVVEYHARHNLSRPDIGRKGAAPKSHKHVAERRLQLSSSKAQGLGVRVVVFYRL